MPADGACALFLDFDGTLVEIAERPEAVVVEPGLSDTLAALRDGLGGALALVSGRSIRTLDGFLDPHRFDAAGLHGVEYRLVGRLSPCRPEEHPKLRAAIASLPERLPPHPGVLVEDKGCSVVLHWRLAPEHEDEVMRVATGLAEAVGAEYRLQRGKAVAEILPARASKGGIIEFFLDQPPFAGRKPIFVGDDTTDHAAFAVLPDFKGIGYSVGGIVPGASFNFDGPKDVRMWLEDMSRGVPVEAR
jgi:trehalose 6-phosphate phosphatase